MTKIENLKEWRKRQQAHFKEMKWAEARGRRVRRERQRVFGENPKDYTPPAV